MPLLLLRARLVYDETPLPEIANVVLEPRLRRVTHQQVQPEGRRAEHLQLLDGRDEPLQGGFGLVNPVVNDEPEVSEKLPHLAGCGQETDRGLLGPGYRVVVGFIVMLASRVWIDESEDLADCFLQHVCRQIGDAPRLSHAPVEALDLV